MAEIDKVFFDLKTRLRKFPNEFGQEFLSRVRERTPVLTGKLQRDWGYQVKAGVVEVYNIADYASFVEWGTEKMAPRGMLRTTALEVDEISAIALERSKK